MGPCLSLHLHTHAPPHEVRRNHGMYSGATNDAVHVGHVLWGMVCGARLRLVACLVAIVVLYVEERRVAPGLVGVHPLGDRAERATLAKLPCDSHAEQLVPAGHPWYRCFYLHRSAKQPMR